MGLSGSNSAKRAAIVIALLCAASALSAQETKRAAAIPLPPMGWSSWNSFSNNISSDIAIAQAKAMISTGMHKSGYQYINIDEGWWLGKRDANGNILVDPKAWPAIKPGERAGDMANIVRYIHSLGLKAGIYTDAASRCTVHAPHSAMPQPNLVPVRPTTSRMAHSRGIFGSASKLVGLPLRTKDVDMVTPIGMGRRFILQWGSSQRGEITIGG